MIGIRGLGMISGLGQSVHEHAHSILNQKSALHALTKCDWIADEISEGNPLLKCGTIADRQSLLSRKWSPVSKLSTLVAKQAIEDASLTNRELENAAVIVGTSRGNTHMDGWPQRRPFKMFRASNGMHGEVASAVTIEFSIYGPWQVLASACAASLDALGMAWMMIRSGVVKHAIVIGAELPVVDAALRSYMDSEVLSTNGVNDPYAANTSGFFPAEAGAAVVLAADEGDIAIDGYWCNSEAYSPVGMHKDGRGVAACLTQAKGDLLALNKTVKAICPHATGTSLHSQAEQAALKSVFKESEGISLHLLKPFTGHAVGASGVLDVALLAHSMRAGILPPNLSGLSNVSGSEHSFTLSDQNVSYSGGAVLKVSEGMGGHNSIVALSAK